MKTERFEAVVLSLSDYGEGHRLVRLFIPSRGLVRAFAPGARRSRRRFGGALDPMAHLEVVLTQRNGRALPSLDEATGLHLRMALREQLERLLLATYLTEIVGQVLREEQEQTELFAYLLLVYDHLEAGDFPAWGRVAVELAVLSAYGANPQVEVCTRCGRVPSGERSRWALGSGGLLCGHCEARHLPGDREIARRTLQALRGIGRGQSFKDQLACASALPPDAEAQDEASEVLGATLEQLLGQLPRSRKILESLAVPGVGQAPKGDSLGSKPPLA